MAKFQGPVRPGRSEKKFRETGKSVPKFQGPTRPGTDVEKFRETGKSVPRRGGGGGRGGKVLGPTRADFEKQIQEAKIKAEKEAKQRAEKEKIKQSLEKAKLEVKRREAIRQRKISDELPRRELQRSRALRELTPREGVRKEGVVSEVEKPKKTLPKIISKIKEERLKLRTQRLREKKGKPEKISRELKLAGLTVLQTGVEGLSGYKQLLSTLTKAPKGIIKLVKNPKNIVTGTKAIPDILKKTGKEIKKEAKQFGELLRISPTEALARVGAEILILKGTSKGIKVAGKLTNQITARVSPKFVGVARPGAELIVKTSKGKKTLQVAGGLKGKLAPIETIERQAKLAGKTVQGVSAQADELVNFIKNKKLLRKPIPNEENIRGITKKLLNRFDEGKIKSSELKKLDFLLKKSGNKGLLERSFFADPRGRIRGSRIGEEKRATFFDLLTEDISLKKPKPQILLFPDTKIQTFPKELKKIQNKLKIGKTLTKKESDKLLEFQLKKSGKFKPVGFLSKESEITLAPGEIIKKVKKRGVTLINGKKVPIVEVKIVKASDKAKKLLKKGNLGKLTNKETKKLKKILKKETGFKTSISSAKKGKKFVSLKGISLKTVSKILRKKKIISPRPSIKPSPRISPKPRPRPSIKPSPRISPKPRPRPSIKPSPRIERKKKIIKKKFKLKEGFIPFGKFKGKKLRLSKKPLSKIDAKDRLAAAIDRTTARTGSFKSVGKVKKLGRLRKGEKSAFTKARKKFRQVRIKRGKKTKLINTFIEKKGKPLIDTKGEKKGLTLAKFRKQKLGFGKRKVKRRSKR